MARPCLKGWFDAVVADYYGKFHDLWASYIDLAGRSMCVAINRL